MKIYADELPKHCGECPCLEKGFANCNLTKKSVFHEYCSDTRPTDCPLQSIADHDAELLKYTDKRKSV